MTAVYITIDTEYSSEFARRRGVSARSMERNFARSITCETPDGAVGIMHKMDVMEQHGLRGVFFVDPMPALIWGTAAIRRVVEPIVARGHDVQLHLHAEWLELARDNNPLGARTGRNIGDFSFEDQLTLLSVARDFLIEAGAPDPVAFRAGNYGANDDTLRALAQLGIGYDTSHTPGISDSECQITLGPDDHYVIDHCGVREVPVGTIPDFGGLRHAQLTALSSWEIGAALRYAQANGVAMLNIVSHSFELLSRNRRRVNTIVRDRFASLCRGIAETDGVYGATFSSRPPALHEETGCAAMPHNELRCAWRIAEQLVANSLYGK